MLQSVAIGGEAWLFKQKLERVKCWLIYNVPICCFSATKLPDTHTFSAEIFSTLASLSEMHWLWYSHQPSELAKLWHHNVVGCLSAAAEQNAITCVKIPRLAFLIMLLITNLRQRWHEERNRKEEHGIKVKGYSLLQNRFLFHKYMLKWLQY